MLSTSNKIKQLFIDKGFYNCTVDIEQVKDTASFNHVSLMIDVNKNEKVKIQSITIVGNDAFSQTKLKSSLKETKEQSSFRPLIDFDGMFLASAIAFMNKGQKRGFEEILTTTMMMVKKEVLKTITIRFLFIWKLTRAHSTILVI